MVWIVLCELPGSAVTVWGNLRQLAFNELRLSSALPSELGVNRNHSVFLLDEACSGSKPEISEALTGWSQFPSHTISCCLTASCCAIPSPARLKVNDLIVLHTVR
jgi:hypothetical protein